MDKRTNEQWMLFGLVAWNAAFLGAFTIIGMGIGSAINELAKQQQEVVTVERRHIDAGEFEALRTRVAELEKQQSVNEREAWEQRLEETSGRHRAAVRDLRRQLEADNARRPR